MTLRDMVRPMVLLVLASCGPDVRTDPAAFAANAAEAPSLLPAATDSATSFPAAERTITTVLYSERDADVIARRAGVVRAIRVELGDAVASGAVLAVLEDDEERAAHASTEAAVELSTAEHDRLEKLVEQSMATRAELETATYRLRAAEAALAEAAIRLNHTRVAAPFAGAVSRRHVRVGQPVEVGDPLFRITALRPLRALLRLPEADAATIAGGQLVRLHGVNGAETTGRVLRVSPAVDPGSGTVEVLVDVPDPAGLRPGSTVEARIAVAEKR
jgi:RND family efflux transporter MFP subunit